MDFGLCTHGNNCINNNMNFKEFLLENINIDAIEKIESSGGKNIHNKKSGASGSMQIHNKGVWNEIMKSLGQNWSWEKHRFDRGASRAAGNHYINIIIPRYLKSYKIPDTIEARLAAYNWGIGNVVKAYRSHKENWITALPSETKNYIEKYNALAGTLPTVIPTEPAKSVVPQVDSTMATYKVKPNDNLDKIAKLHKKTLKTLILANPQIKNPNFIKPGQIINIPA